MPGASPFEFVRTLGLSELLSTHVAGFGVQVLQREQPLHR